MSNTSFYGGQSGKDFKISAIFRNKSELIADLNKRWNSSINVGELVLISYGLPAMDSIRDENGNLLPMPDSKSEFMQNKNSDWEKFKKTYNSTLWIKIYKEESKLSQEYEELLQIEKEFVSANDDSAKDFGLGYALLASFTGETPYLQITHDIINADKAPYISPDNDSTPEVPKYTLHLPQSQVLTEENFSYNFVDPMAGKELVHASVDYKADPNIPEKDQTKGSINRPSLNMTFPFPWKFHLDFDYIDADQHATGVLTNRKELSDGSYTEDSETKDTKYFTVRFPKAYQVDRIVQVNDIKTGETPTAFIDKLLDDPNNEASWRDGSVMKVTYNSPRPQKIRPQDVKRIVVAPETYPSITWNEDNIYNTEKDSGTPEHPELTFNLPRAAKHIFGDEEPALQPQGNYLFVANKDNPDLSPSLIKNLQIKIGDYYIWRETGDIWVIYEINGTVNPEKADTSEYVSIDSISLRYEACLAGLMEQPDVHDIDSYINISENKITADVNKPQITLQYKDTVNKRHPYYRFDLPLIPKIETDYISVGSAEASKLEQTFTARATKFTFTVADGTKWFVGNEVTDNTTSAVVEGARDGDMYLHFTTATDYTNSNRGNVYKLSNNTWSKVGNLVGPTGKALNIVNTIRVESVAGLEEETNIKNQLNTIYNINKPTPDQLIAINYYDTETKTTHSYWYYWDSTANDWKNVIITGGLGDLIKTSYYGQDDNSHTYSTKYINTLIKHTDNITGSQDIEKTTYSAGKINDKFNTVNDNITSLNNTIQETKTELIEKIQEATSWGNISDLIG